MIVLLDSGHRLISIHFKVVFFNCYFQQFLCELDEGYHIILLDRSDSAMYENSKSYQSYYMFCLYFSVYHDALVLPFNQIVYMLQFNQIVPEYAYDAYLVTTVKFSSSSQST